MFVKASKMSCEESQESQESPRGSPMAFIIAFDDDGQKKKKMNIKDSIRQFAPPKPDFERTRHVKSDDDTSSMTMTGKRSPINDKVMTSRVESVSVKYLLNDSQLKGHNISDSASYLIQRMLYNQQCDDAIHDPITDCDDRKDRKNGKCTQMKQITQSSRKSPINDKVSPGERDSGVSDDKSESGTYTVELEHDYDLEEARKKIDEVFGVLHNNRNAQDNDVQKFGILSPHISSPDDDDRTFEGEMNRSSDTTFWLNNNNNKVDSYSQTNPLTNMVSPQTTRKFQVINNYVSDNKVNHEFTGGATFTRPKRKVHDQMTQSDTETHKYYSNHLKNLISNNGDENLPKQTSITNKSSNIYNYDNNNWIKQQMNKPVTINKSMTIPHSPIVNRKVNETQFREIRRPLLPERRKLSLTNSNCDSFSEYSDDSAEPSVRSSNSAQSRNDGDLSSSSLPSKLRFNKAFALRRARLGLETPGIPINIQKTNSKSPLAAQNNKAQRTNERTPNNSTNFARNDGGRFSLRLPRNANNRSAVIAAPVKRSPKDDISKIPVFRKPNDNGNKLNPLFKSASKSAFSDTEHMSMKIYTNPKDEREKSAELQKLQKSASFNESKSSIIERKSDVSVRNSTAFQIGKRTLSTNQQLENFFRHANMTDAMTSSSIVPQSETPPSELRKKFTQQLQRKSPRELSALDSLVVTAINQLSQKLRNNLCEVLEKERMKYPNASEMRHMIDELLPQLSSPNRRLIDNNESTVSKDLSNILKNLKKVEQSLDVVSSLFHPNTVSQKSIINTSYFEVDV